MTLSLFGIVIAIHQEVIHGFALHVAYPPVLDATGFLSLYRHLELRF